MFRLEKRPVIEMLENLSFLAEGIRIDEITIE